MCGLCVFFLSLCMLCYVRYFTQPDGVPGGMLLLQGSLFVLQMLHTSLVLLPMFALVKQMGTHAAHHTLNCVALRCTSQQAPTTQ